MGTTQNLRPLRRAAFRLAGWQTVLTAAIAVVAAILGGAASAQAALIGGGIGIIAGLYQALRMFSVSAADDPARFLRAVYAGEAVKIVLSAALFVAAIRVTHPKFAPMIVAYAATFLVYWVALGTGYPWMEDVNPDRAVGGPDAPR